MESATHSCTTLIYDTFYFSVSSEKDLVQSVLHKINGNNPYGITENVQFIVHVLSKACCFEMKQNDKFSSTLYIKSEYEKYENLRGVFDSTFIGMIIKTGLIVSSEQWSSLLYGDVKYEVAMEIIIKKFSTSDTFTKSIEKLLQILEQAGVHQNNLSKFETSFKFLPTIYLNINNDNEDNRLSWMKIALVIKTFREGVQCLPYFNQ
ncbi:unnamed protein product [Rotaria sp. Silwood1]|nr:unnamed protein product [Rotaria sp. Silwood1]